MKKLTIDLETIPDVSLIDILPAVKQDVRLKDPEKIKLDIAKKIEKQKSDMGLSPLTNIICCAGFADSDGMVGSLILKDEQSEKQLLNDFWEVCADYEHFIGFNSRSFDVRCLNLHSMRHGVRPSVTINASKYNKGNHTDLRPILAGEGQFAKGNLEFFARLFLGKGKTDGINGEDVWQYWQMGEKEFIAEYCEEDCEITRDLFVMAEKSGLIESLM